MAEKVIRTLRDFPAIETLLQSETIAPELARVPRPIAAEIVRTVVSEQKERFDAGQSELAESSLIDAIKGALRDEAASRMTRVINATGIVVHTNLGRAPLSQAIFRELEKTAVGYCNIEFGLSSGKRGGRGVACERYLAALAGAEAGTVVNNNAAALFLILNTLANRKNVVISRGELVQIGGGFRIPDILKRSGARLVEVGTTNVTTLADYDKAVDDKTALILKVHKSNFVQAGFTQEVDLRALVALGRKRGIPVVNDLGSGTFVATRELLGYAEPTVQGSVRDGAALTCFSGDKMLGGVQAGLIVGQRDLVSKVKKNPLFRTVRVDKIVFSVLEGLLEAHLNDTYRDRVKLWQILARPTDELRAMAMNVLARCGTPADVTVEDTSAFIGGGAMPEQSLPSVGLVFSPVRSANQLMTAFRGQQPPVIGRIDTDRFILDFKAIDSEDLVHIVSAIQRVLK
ncbi:MAG: L-seryl-tRNA(Sec) selenium transferase [Candidatus Zixiibacteriota bacterium]